MCTHASVCMTIFCKKYYGIVKYIVYQKIQKVHNPNPKQENTNVENKTETKSFRTIQRPNHTNQLNATKEKHKLNPNITKKKKYNKIIIKINNKTIYVAECRIKMKTKKRTK